MSPEPGSGSRPLRVLAIISPSQTPHLLAPSPARPRFRPAPPTSRESLARALTACLELLESDPARFQRAATAWHARWRVQTPALTLAEARATLAALAALSGPDPAAGAQELARHAIHHGDGDLARVLDRWIAGRRAAAARPGTEQLPTISTAVA
jgi:hypothetical protein